jgi:hypothetical protein
MGQVMVGSLAVLGRSSLAGIAVAPVHAHAYGIINPGPAEEKSSQAARCGHHRSLHESCPQCPAQPAAKPPSVYNSSHFDKAVKLTDNLWKQHSDLGGAPWYSPHHGEARAAAKI